MNTINFVNLPVQLKVAVEDKSPVDSSTPTTISRGFSIIDGSAGTEVNSYTDKLSGLIFKAIPAAFECCTCMYAER